MEDYQNYEEEFVEEEQESDYIVDLRNEFPLSVNIVLYEYNYTDKKLLSKIKSNAVFFYGETEKDLIVDSKDLEHILDTYFEDEISEYNSYSSGEELAQYVTSIFFIKNILQHWKNLESFEIHCSKQRYYTRMIRENLNFAHQIKIGQINLNDYSDNKALNKLLLDDLNIEKDSYTEVKDFVDKLMNLDDNDEFMKEGYGHIVDKIMSVITQKIELDNPTVKITC